MDRRLAEARIANKQALFEKEVATKHGPKEQESCVAWVEHATEFVMHLGAFEETKESEP